MARGAGKWTADEDMQWKATVGAQGTRNWDAIAALIPGRTRIQCQSRWHGNLASNIDPTTACAGQWTEDEDKKLRDAVINTR
jgi:hypothetical protein